MRPRNLIVTLALALSVGCQSPGPKPPPPMPKLPNYGGMADQVVSWLPKDAAVALAYMDLTQIEEVQGKEAAKTIRSTYPDRMDIYLANAARTQPIPLKVVDRRNMTHFLAEQKLQASDMVPFDPSSRVKLKQITAVNTYVYWKVVREGDIEEWLLRAVAVETGEVYGGLVHRFRIPEDLRVKPQVGELTAEDFYNGKARKRFQLALKGNARAMVYVGNEIERKQVDDYELLDPQEWFVKAGDAGYPEGYYRAGLLYTGPRNYRSWKVKNWVTAKTWFEKAAAQGHVQAHEQLGWMHLRGLGTPADPKQAFVHYEQAAQGGSARAMNLLGYILDHGKLGKADPKAAAAWYRKGAESKDGVAASNLGLCYRDGRGVPKSDAQAIRWFRRAADLRSGVGMANLAWMYEHGRGVKKDLSQAREWYSKAAGHGHKSGAHEAQRLWTEIQQAFQAWEAKVLAATWVVVPRTLELRAGPYPSAKAIELMKQGHRLRVISTHRNGEFWEVRSRFRSGFVPAKLLRRRSEPASPTVKTKTKEL